MNATSLLVSTTRLVLMASDRGVGDPSTLSDLYRLVPYLRQSLSCTVCGQLLCEPFTPQAVACQHHVCRGCLGGRKILKPGCASCRDYQKYEVNVQLRILLQCYRHLCKYIVSKPMYRHIISGVAPSTQTTPSLATHSDANASNVGGPNSQQQPQQQQQQQQNGSNNGSSSCAVTNSLLELIEEGARFKDTDYKSNDDQLKSTYAMLPCVYNLPAPLATLPPPVILTTATPAPTPTTTTTSQLQPPPYIQPVEHQLQSQPSSDVTTASPSKQQHPNTIMTVSSAAAASSSASSSSPLKVSMHQQHHPHLAAANAQQRPQMQQHPHAIPMARMMMQQPQQQAQLIRHPPATHIRMHNQQQPQKLTLQPHASNQPNTVTQHRPINTIKWIAAATAKFVAASNNSSSIRTNPPATGTFHPSAAPSTLPNQSHNVQQQQRPTIANASAVRQLSSQQQQPRHSAAAQPSYTLPPTTAPIKTVSNGSAMYSVLYAGTGNKITIKRKTDGSGHAATVQQQQQQSQPQVAYLQRPPNNRPMLQQQQQHQLAAMPRFVNTSSASALQQQQLLTSTATSGQQTQQPPLHKDHKLPATLLSVTSSSSGQQQQSLIRPSGQQYLQSTVVASQQQRQHPAKTQPRPPAQQHILHYGPATVIPLNAPSLQPQLHYAQTLPPHQPQQAQQSFKIPPPSSNLPPTAVCLNPTIAGPLAVSIFNPSPSTSAAAAAIASHQPSPTSSMSSISPVSFTSSTSSTTSPANPPPTGSGPLTPLSAAAAAAAAAAKRKGCRCGNATPTPGKLTCCGQRCPCYVDAKSCIDCKCRGCRNPHRADGFKIRPHIPELDCIDIPLAPSSSTLTLSMSSSSLQQHDGQIASTSGATMINSSTVPPANNRSGSYRSMSQTFSPPNRFVTSTAANQNTNPPGFIVTSSSSQSQSQSQTSLLPAPIVVTPSMVSPSLDSNTLHGLATNRDSTISNPSDGNHFQVVYTSSSSSNANQPPPTSQATRTLNYTMPVSIQNTIPSSAGTSAVSVVRSSFFSSHNALLRTHRVPMSGGKPQSNLLATVGNTDSLVDDNDDEDDDDEEDDDDDGGGGGGGGGGVGHDVKTENVDHIGDPDDDDDDAEDEDNDINDKDFNIDGVEESDDDDDEYDDDDEDGTGGRRRQSAEQKRLATAATSPAVAAAAESAHIDVPEVDVYQFDHLLDSAHFPTALTVIGHGGRSNSRNLGEQPPVVPAVDAVEQVGGNVAGGDDNNDDDEEDDDVEDDDANDKDFSMSDEPSDVDIDI